MSDGDAFIRLILAGAGTGKTRRLVDHVEEATIGPGETVPSTALVATTFTVKAARELLERARRRFLERGRADLSDRFLLGRVGTVNAVAGRLVADFAFDLELSPSLEVLAETGQEAFFRRALSEVFEGHRDRLEPARRRLEVDLATVVLDIVQHARANGLGASELETCAQKSWNSFRRLLPETEDGGQLDENLRDSVQRAFQTLRERADLKKDSRNALNILSSSPIHRNVELCTWRHWAQLSKMKANAPERNVIAPVCAAASRHPSHPRFHADIEATIDGVFRCAAEALDRYERAKREFGLLDFVDQEERAVELLGKERARRHLAEDLRQLLVDEFQDTSPIQLALFMKLARIFRKREGVPAAVWVGDPKQAVYGFRGTDPELVHSLGDRLVAGGAARTERLSVCYRARPGLVAFTNDVFGPAFAAQGMEEEAARLEAHRTDDGKSLGPPLHLWHLDGTEWKEASGALAEGIRTILAQGSSWQVEDHGRLRAPRGSDIAVLCRTNDRRMNVANALAAAGLEVAIERERLLDAPEAAYGFAALRYVVDPSDTLALAEMVHLREDRDDEGPQWLDCWLRKGREEIRVRHPACAALDAVRSRLDELTPSEALEAALMASGAADFARSLGDPVRRLANIDALRGLAKRYEEVCRQRRGAATAGGLVAWIRHDVENGGMQPPSPSAHAVQVSTYHGAKGLEWPIVILLDLQDRPKPNPFGVNVEPREGHIDPEDPLAGRWVRYWPWPYHRNHRNLHIDTKARETEEHRRLERKERNELVRLLYVGMTRARDYLILARRNAKDGVAWLDLLVDDGGQKVLVLPDPSADPGMRVAVAGGKRHDILVRRLATPTADDREERDPVPVFGPARRNARDDTVRARSYRLRASTETEASGIRILEEVEIGGRLALAGRVEMERLGEALHAFLAADRTEEEPEWRRGLAERLVDTWDLGRAIRADDFIEAADRLRRFLNERHPGFVWHREWPVTGRIEGQRVQGRIDLLLRSDTHIVVVDHKSFPGREEQWREHARGAGAQLLAYARLVRAATGIGPEIWVHLPIVGRMVRLDAA